MLQVQYLEDGAQVIIPARGVINIEVVKSFIIG